MTVDAYRLLGEPESRLPAGYDAAAHAAVLRRASVQPVCVPTEGLITGRNGEHHISAVRLRPGFDGSAVFIEFISKAREQNLRAGGYIDATAMDQLATEWLAARRAAGAVP